MFIYGERKIAIKFLIFNDYKTKIIENKLKPNCPNGTNTLCTAHHTGAYFRGPDSPERYNHQNDLCLPCGITGDTEFLSIQLKLDPLICSPMIPTHSYV